MYKIKLSLSRLKWGPKNYIVPPFMAEKVKFVFIKFSKLLWHSIQTRKKIMEINFPLRAYLNFFFQYFNSYKISIIILS